MSVKVRYLKTINRVIIMRLGEEDWERYLDTRLGDSSIVGGFMSEYHIKFEDWAAVKPELEELFDLDLRYIRGGYTKSYQHIWRKRRDRQEA